SPISACLIFSPGSGPLPLVIETPTAVYEYASDRLDWWHARLYCQQRFAQLPSESWEDELSSLGQNLSRQLQSTVWLEDEELLQRKPKPRRAHSPSTLIFGNKTDTKFVKVLADFPAMAAVSACAHVQWDPTATEVSTVFSYAVPAFTNEFQLRGIVDKDQFVKLAVILHGHHSPYLPVFRTDPHWHHVCVTWKQPNGTWVLYADGKQKASASGLAASRAIDGHGMFIIGQDQDSLGGAFKEKESFSGNLTDLQVWGRFLSQEQVEKVRSCVSIREGLIFDWRHDILEVETSVQEARVQLTCPGESPTCRGWGVNATKTLGPFPNFPLMFLISLLLLVGRRSCHPACYTPLFLLRHLSTQVASSIISSSLVSNYEEISTSVRYRLRHRVQVFLLFSPEGVGGWSTRGCSVSSSQEDLTTCACNHTTNFAVLLQVYEVQRSLEEESTLKTLTFVGCGVSFCALIVTLVLFLAVGVPKSERTTVHKNLIFALAAAEALLMFSELAKVNQGVCFAVTAFLHLFFMAAFAWMLVEGLLLWSKVVAVNMSEDRRMRFYYVTGWGLPVLIVGVTLATSFNKYVADNHCWLNVQTEVIWAFVGPVLFVLTVNTFVLFRVVMVTVSSARRRSRMLTPNSSLEKQIGVQIWATTKPILVLLPVLGLTWVCGILVHLSVTWAYIFIMLNSLQVSLCGAKLLSETSAEGSCSPKQGPAGVARKQNFCTQGTQAKSEPQKIVYWSWL
uniref:Adhesion G protein-coupled receptor D2 n=1 Tax=Naja naja TaxID=35670 RepID=A0A8C6Y032_NAJNA